MHKLNSLALLRIATPLSKPPAPPPPDPPPPPPPTILISDMDRLTVVRRFGQEANTPAPAQGIRGRMALCPGSSGHLLHIAGTVLGLSAFQTRLRFAVLSLGCPWPRACGGVLAVALIQGHGIAAKDLVHFGSTALSGQGTPGQPKNRNRISDKATRNSEFRISVAHHLRFTLASLNLVQRNSSSGSSNLTQSFRK